jgi:hypothetical protein
MRSTVLAVSVLALGCAKAEKPPEAAPPAPAPAPAMFDLSAAVGKWDYVTKSMTGDTVLVKAEVTATADPAGWTILLPGRPVMPLKVTVSGDSLITHTGPYESVLRKGVQVTTDGVLRMMNGKLMGQMAAHYSVKTADSVRMLMVEATKRP